MSPKMRMDGRPSAFQRSTLGRAVVVFLGLFIAAALGGSAEAFRAPKRASALTDQGPMREAAGAARVARSMSAPVACTPPAWSALSTPAGGVTPETLAVGDFNEDGRPDLVISDDDAVRINYVDEFGDPRVRFDGASHLAVRLGADGGVLGTPTTLLALAPQLGGVAVADVNGDGHQDLLSVADDNPTLPADNPLLAVYFGDGSGAFSAPSSFDIGGGIESRPRGLVVGDFNGDSRPDVAVALSLKSLVNVLVGDGVGGFSSPASNTVTNTVELATADVDEDGKRDLVTAGTNSFAFVRGNGDGSFQVPITFAMGTAVAGVIAADLNGDSHTDVAAANSGSANVSVRLGNGAGGFGAATNFAAGASPSGLVAADLDGDGDLDLAVASGGSASLSILTGNGAGGFGAPASLPAGLNPSAVVAADLNGDGKQDLVSANSGAGSVTIQTEMCALALASLGTYPTGVVQAAKNLSIAPSAAPSGDPSRGMVATAPGHFRGTLAVDNATGVLRVANAHPAGAYTLTVTARNGIGTTTRSLGLTVSDAAACTPITFPVTFDAAQAGAEAVAVADVNGDGRQDVLTAGGIHFTSRLGDGLGGLGASKTITVAGADQRAVAVGDVNGDGRLDAVLADIQQDKVWMLSGDGLGGFGSTGSLSPGAGTAVDGVALGDVDGDGRLDLAVTNGAGGAVAVFAGDGLGGFGAPLTYTVGTNPESVALADLNGDGNADLAVANRNSNNVSVRLGTGTGSFGAATSFAVGATPRAIAVVDLDEDGDPDVATANQGSNNVSVLLNSGTGSFAAATGFATAAGPVALGVGDFDGDSNLDLVTASGGAGSVAVLAGNGAGGLGTAVSFTVTSPAALATADLNADGKQDLVTTSATAGRVQVLLESCATGAPTLGTYAPVTVTLGGAATVLPSAAPGGDTPHPLLLSAPPALQGTFELDQSTGGVRVTNAYPAGAFTVTVKAQNGAGSITRSFVLTVTSPPACAGPAFGPMATIGDYATGGVGVADFNMDGRLDTVAFGTAGGTNLALALRLGDGAGGLGTPRTQIVTGSSLNGFVSALGKGLVVGDFNGDGRADVAVASEFMRTTPPHEARLTVFVGDGQGNLALGSELVISSWADLPSPPMVGDLNGDGRLDLVMSTGSASQLVVFLGDGSGGFLTPPAIYAGAGGGNAGVVLGDLDRDGDTDIVATNPGGSTVAVLLNTGTGAIGAPVTFTVGASPQGVALGDVNGDAYPDVVAADFNAANVALLVNNGSGSFGAATFLPAGTNPQGVALADLDGDGDLDIAAANAGSKTVSLLTGNGSGAFSAAGTLATAIGGTVAAPIGLSPADFNGDGKLDLVAPFSDRFFAILPGNCAVGPPVLGTYPGASVPAGRTGTVTPSSPPSGGPMGITAVASPLAGTLTVDPATGQVQVVNPAAAGTYTVTLRAHNQAGSATRAFSLTVTSPTACATLGFQELPARFNVGPPNGSQASPYRAVMADFNRDGNLDLLSHGYGRLDLLLGDGAGGFGPRRFITGGGLPSSFADLAVGDVNGDGWLDVLEGVVGGGYTYVLVNDRRGGFYLSNTLSVGTWQLLLGDLNNDGKLDIVNLNPSVVAVALGDGNGGFGSFVSQAGSGSPRGVLGDFNGDGNLDLAAAVNGGCSSTLLGCVGVRLGNGAGALGATSTVPFDLGPSGTIVNAFRVGDFNADGKQDLAFLNPVNGRAHVMLGDGAGGLTNMPPVRIEPSGTNDYVGSLDIADLNGDGKTDLVSGNKAAKSISLRLGDGAGLFGIGLNSLRDLRSTSNTFAVVGDVNGDGRQDIVNANESAGTYSVFLRTCNAAPALGNYPDSTLQTGQTVTITPTAAPIGGPGLSSYAAATGFKGALAVNPATGAVRVMNAYPAGVYTVTVYASYANGTAAATFALTVTDPLRCVSPSFGAPVTYTTGANPSAATLADFNNDGRLDVLVNTGLDEIRLGNGTGGFGPSQAITDSASSVIADFNGDGNLDVFSLCCSVSGLRVRFGDGTGAFPSTGPVLPIALGFGYIPVFRDVNGDGWLDLGLFQFPTSGSPGFTWRLGDGTGAFGAPSLPVTPFVPGTSPTNFLVGDLNGDAKLDVLVPNNAVFPSTQTATTYLGVGGGYFGSGTVGGDFLSVLGSGLADLNRDGRLDFLGFSGGSSNRLSFAFGSGATGLAPSTFLLPPGGLAMRNPVEGDFNGDGVPDMVASRDAAGDVIVLPGLGAGYAAGVTFTVGASPVNQSVGDLNGDGRQDLVAANYNNASISVLLGNCTAVTGNAPTLGDYPDSSVGMVTGGTIAPSAPPGGGAASFTATAVGLDAILTVSPTTGAVTVANPRTRGSFQVKVFARNAAGLATRTFTLKVLAGVACSSPSFAAATTFSLGDATNYLAAGDFNGDGNMDIVETSYTTKLLRILPGNGGGGFGTATVTKSIGALIPGQTPLWVVAGDQNGDGYLDAVMASSNFTTVSYLWTFLGDGSGGLGAPTTFVAGYDGLKLGDVNRDGRSDVGTNDGMRLGYGDGTYAPVMGPTVGSYDMSLADYTGDGILDYAQGAYFNSQTGQFGVVVRPGLGTGGFGPQQVSYGPASPNSVGDWNRWVPGDFDHDGKLDAVIVGGVGCECPGNSHYFWVLRGDGAGGFTFGQKITLPTHFEGARVGDFNGDGQIDIAIVDWGATSVNLYLGRGNATFVAGPVVSMPAAIGEFTLADFNGDGKDDIVATTGSGLYIRLGNCSVVLRGDCNSDGMLNAGDLSALPLEIFDADGPWALDVVSSTYTSGSPAGCDPNVDAVVNAADLTCTAWKVFLGPAACGD